MKPANEQQSGAVNEHLSFPEKEGLSFPRRRLGQRPVVHPARHDGKSPATCLGPEAQRRMACAALHV